MKKVYKYLLAAGMIAAIGSCRKFEDLLQDPNRATPASADVDLYLNQVQLNFPGVFDAAQEFGAELTRMETFYGPTYLNGYTPAGFNGIWSNAYTGVMKNANALIPLAKAQAKFTHAGIAGVLKAYTMFTLVDMFGNVPYSEAVLGTGNLNPKVDQGKDVYAAAITVLDSAIADLARTAATAPVNDLFGFGGTTQRARWTTVAKTLKLRAYNNTRLVDASVGAKIQALLTENDLIDTDAEDFTFRFGSKQANPNSRHPKYNSGYVASGGAGDYIGTYFLFALWAEKPASAFDPRRRFYTYRQTLATPGNISQMPCAFNSPPAHYTAGTPYCFLPGGLWGRDHGDNGGIPPDGQLRTVFGVYPAGGQFDANQGTRTVLNQGAQGAGIHPIWMSFFTEFVKAEAALTTAGVTANARVALEAGIRKSINRVINFPAQIGHVGTVTIPTQAQIDSYVNFVLGQYDAAATNDAKLDVVLKEYYLALWGNGLDAFNMYRRTCRPKNLQPAIQAQPGAFIRSFLYPTDHVGLNTNATQKPDVTTKVFWDNNGNCAY